MSTLTAFPDYPYFFKVFIVLTWSLSCISQPSCCCTVFIWEQALSVSLLAGATGSNGGRAYHCHMPVLLFLERARSLSALGYTFLTCSFLSTGSNQYASVLEPLGWGAAGSLVPPSTCRQCPFPLWAECTLVQKVPCPSCTRLLKHPRQHVTPCRGLPAP